MKKRCAFTLTETAIVIAAVGVLAAVLMPAAISQTEASKRKKCTSNLKQIVVACITYSDSNGDFFPCHWDGRQLNGSQVTDKTQWEGFENPMQSLAILYPLFIDDPRVFGYPSTEDKPKITLKVVGGLKHACFGDPGKLDPSLFQGMAKNGSCATAAKCSYLYDPQCHFRAAGPGQAIAADADGYTWTTPGGKQPEYRKNWFRNPAKSNHEGGQNVMYFDGHVKWCDTVFCSDEPQDNIFAIELRADPDVDAALWDEGCDSRDPMVGQYPDTINP